MHSDISKIALHGFSITPEFPVFRSVCCFTNRNRCQ